MTHLIPDNISSSSSSLSVCISLPLDSSSCTSLKRLPCDSISVRLSFVMLCFSRHSSNRRLILVHSKFMSHSSLSETVPDIARVFKCSNSSWRVKPSNQIMQKGFTSIFFFDQSRIIDKPSQSLRRQKKSPVPSLPRPYIYPSFLIHLNTNSSLKFKTFTFT